MESALAFFCSPNDAMPCHFAITVLMKDDLGAWVQGFLNPKP